MTTRRKYDFPVHEVRRFLEPGPVVLVSSAYKGKRDIMTMGWHMVMEFEPSRLGCFITDANYSFDLIRKSRECVINIPTADMASTVARIGNCSGRDLDKFDVFGLTAQKAARVQAPLIRECHANIECTLEDSRMINKYGLFIWKVVKVHALRRPKYPRTIHYRGAGVFMVSGKTLDLSRHFKPENL